MKSDRILVAALLTCHNRRERTIECLSRLMNQDRLAAPHRSVPCVSLDVILVDDGSTDGTADAVRERFPAVRIVSGPGDLYWAGGMRRAWSAAAGSGPHDAYLLLNDDTLLTPSALGSLLDTADFARQKHGTPGIAVGSILDDEGRHHYGGALWWRGRGPVIPSGEPMRCDLFNCNATLISADAYRVLGGFSDVFTHSMADYEYGCRAQRAGVPCYIAGGYIGTCPRNPTPEWLSAETSFRRRWSVIHHPKGLPPREYRHLCRALYSWRWPFAFVTTYLRIMLPLLRRRICDAVDGAGR